MPDTLPRIAAAEWSEHLAALGAATGRRVLIAGERAAETARALSRIDAPPLVATIGDMAVLADGAVSLGEDAVPHSTGLPSATFDLVIYLRAWRGHRGLVDAVTEAKRLVAPGGMVVLGELNGALLVRARPGEFGSALLYRAHPAVGRELVNRCVDRSAMDVEAVRAGLRDVVAMAAERTVGVFSSVDSYARAVGDGLWRGWSSLSEGARAAMAAEISRMETALPVIEREPWHLISGQRRP